MPSDKRNLTTTNATGLIYQHSVSLLKNFLLLVQSSSILQDGQQCSVMLSIETRIRYCEGINAYLEVVEFLPGFLNNNINVLIHDWIM